MTQERVSCTADRLGEGRTASGEELQENVTMTEGVDEEEREEQVVDRLELCKDEDQRQKNNESSL